MMRPQPCGFIQRREGASPATQCAAVAAVHTICAAAPGRPHAAIHPDRPRGAVPAPRRERVHSFLGLCSSLLFSSTPPPAQAGSVGTAAGALLRAARQPIPPGRRRAPTAIRAPGSTPAPARAPALPRRSWDLLIRRASTQRASRSRTRLRARGVPVHSVRARRRVRIDRLPLAAQVKGRLAHCGWPLQPARHESWSRSHDRCAARPTRLPQPARPPKRTPPPVRVGPVAAPRMRRLRLSATRTRTAWSRRGRVGRQLGRHEAAQT